MLGAVAVGATLMVLPVEALSADLARLLLVCGAVIGALLLARGRTQATANSEASFRMALVIWWFVLCSEAFFPRPNNGAENAAAGRFSFTAYSEAIFWVFLALCFVVVVFPTLPRLKTILQTRFGLAFGVVALSTVSVLWAPEKVFSLAWSFKLLLGVSVIAYSAASLRSLRDLRTLLVVTFWAFMFLTVAPVIDGTLNPNHAFSGTSYAGEAVVEQGRFHSSAHPLVIAGRAGILALLSLLFYSLERKRKMIVVAAGCALVMGLAGAKTAFLAAAISVGLLFSLRRRMMAAFGLLLAFGVLAFAVVSLTAVGGYISDYLHSGDLMTLSGRTDLWSAAWPEITSHLALGHGYVASKLVSLQVDISWYAGHLHNAILETLYNNGLPGLVLLLAMNIVILLDLVRLYKHASRNEIRLVATCLLPLYGFIFLNGLTEPYFGGEASAFYLLFIALFGISEWLRRYSNAVAREQIPRVIARPPLVAPAYRSS